MTERFCPECEVSMDLHDDPEDCEGAKERVEALERMDRLMFGWAVRR